MPSASFDDLDELIGWEARLEEHIQGDSPPTRRDDSLFVLGAIVRMREYTHATKLNNLPGDGIAKRGLRPAIAISTYRRRLCRRTRLKSSRDLRLGPSLSTVSRASPLDVIRIGFRHGGVEIARATTVCHVKPDIGIAEDASHMRIR